MDAAVPPPALLAAGCELAGYRIETLIGRGGMGEVYRARQLSLERTVALKILDPRLALRDPAFARRFIAEAHAAGRFNNPAIVRVHDVGEAPAPAALAARGVPRIAYLCMEFVAGESLQERLRRQERGDPALVARVMRGMAAALQYAESEGIIHRDIKPDNIMLAEDGAVKLADLGLAVPEGGGEDPPRDAHGRARVLGTPLYMSPQQALGEALDGRSDQYSLGATLFHLLTGHPPFHGSAREVLRAHVHDPVPDPATQAPAVPEPWRRLCRRLLAKEPAGRFPTAAALRAAVEAAARPARHRHRYRLLLIATVVAATCALAARAALPGTGARGNPSLSRPDPSVPLPLPAAAATPDADWDGLLARLAPERSRLDYPALGAEVAAWRQAQPRLPADIATAVDALAGLASRGEGALRTLVREERPLVDGVGADGRVCRLRLRGLAADAVLWEDPAGNGQGRLPRDGCGIVWDRLLARALLEQAVEPADEVAAATLWLWRDPGRTEAINRIATRPLGRLLAALATAETRPAAPDPSPGRPMGGSGTGGGPPARSP